MKVNVKSGNKRAQIVCLVEFTNRVRKQQVMQNKFKLAKLKRIFIDNDMSIKRIVRKQITVDDERRYGKSVKISEVS